MRSIKDNAYPKSIPLNPQKDFFLLETVILRDAIDLNEQKNNRNPSKTASLDKWGKKGG
jgi:hypothetical protein